MNKNYNDEIKEIANYYHGYISALFDVLIDLAELGITEDIDRLVFDAINDLIKEVEKAQCLKRENTNK